MPTPKCVSCGLCCKGVGPNIAAAKDEIAKGNSDLFTKAIAAFPFPVDDNGACTKLLPNGLCSIYAERPDVCSIHKTWAIFFRKDDEQEFYDDTWNHCEKLMKENNFTIPQ